MTKVITHHEQTVQRAIAAMMPARTASRVRHLYWGERPGRIICMLRPPGGMNIGDEDSENIPSSDPHDADHLRTLETLYAITYALAGRAVLTTRGRTKVVLPGTFLQLNGVERRDFTMTPGPGFAECSANVDGFTGNDLVRMKLWNTRIADGAIGLHLSIVRLYFDLFESLADLTQDAGTLLRKFFAIQAAVYGLYPTTSVEGNFRQRACRLFADNPQPSFRTRDAARIMGVVEPTFRRKFRELTGMAPGDYHLQLRMERAEQLLAHHSVKDTAEQLGYSDPYVFSRQFKRATGMAPSQHLRRSGPARRRAPAAKK